MRRRSICEWDSDTVKLVVISFDLIMEIYQQQSEISGY